MLVEDFGLDRLKAMVKRPLTGLRIGPFYGCYILRPSQILGMDEHPDRDKYLELVIEAVGATVVDYEGQKKCCGFPILTINSENSLKQAGNHINEAQDLGADALVSPCPLCHLNLDAQQPAREAGDAARDRPADPAPAADHRPGAGHRRRRSCGWTTTSSRRRSCWRSSTPCLRRSRRFTGTPLRALCDARLLAASRNLDNDGVAKRRNSGSTWRSSSAGWRHRGRRRGR